MPILEDDTAIAERLRNATTIAVVGLSARPERDSHRVALYLQHHRYRIYPVNPSVASVLGEASYPDLLSIGAPVDIVDIFRRPEFVPAIVEEAIRAGARCVWMQFDTAHEEAAAVAAAAGLDVIVDRCIMVEHRRLIG
jgi:hypothetical protein